MQRRFVRVIVLSLVGLAGPALGTEAYEEAVPLAALDQLPVREITVFKDGHAFVSHEGELPVDEAGDVHLDHLPRPVLGTFWPYVPEGQTATLEAVVAGQRRVSVERTALWLQALIEANVGKSVVITEVGAQHVPGPTYAATIVGIPARSAKELAAAAPPNAPEALPLKGDVVLLRTSEGTKAVPLARIQDVTFDEPPTLAVREEEFRNLLSLKLRWAEGKTKPRARVGLAYLERGIRWIPSYRINIDGKGNAELELRATLVNELLDLENVTANLVIGAPSFMFADTVDPIALQAAVVQLAQHAGPASQFGNFSNAIMTQQAHAAPQYQRPEGSALDLGPEVADSGKNEDLYMFTVRNLSLKRGERMVLPVTRMKLSYRDVYTLDIPFTASPELMQRMNSDQQREMAKLLARPKVEHKIRLTNTGTCPLTTAPALILRDGRLLGQGMMTYASVGSTSDVKITTAIDVKADRRDVETKRTPDALRVNGSNYGRVDLSGTVHLKNMRSTVVDVEVSRYLLGHIDKATPDGTLEKGGRFDYDMLLGLEGGAQLRSNWPHWYDHVNGIAKAFWRVSIEPGNTADLTYTWHYFWR
jgi:hypothetical protein